MSLSWPPFPHHYPHMWKPGLSDPLILMPLAPTQGQAWEELPLERKLARAVVIGEALHWGFAGAQAGGGETFW